MCFGLKHTLVGNVLDVVEVERLGGAAEREGEARLYFFGFGPFPTIGQFAYAALPLPSKQYA